MKYWLMKSEPNKCSIEKNKWTQKVLYEADQETIGLQTINSTELKVLAF